MAIKLKNTSDVLSNGFKCLVYKSLGLPNRVNRDKVPPEVLEKIASRENTVQALLREGKTYHDIKAVLDSLPKLSVALIDI